ncbi:TetR/AcrR family transcriptional regulator [Holdemania massiliensis]|uniref:TetR/AcrR family transcriptional regulator n=1 Tax=Holdemania massiliensis TaxID=1468449 RepID=UPI00030E5370|nr:TetR/AcrR family transcriptional regulator [Holdemania massiliensis]
MPKVAYSESEREQIKKALIDTGLKLFSTQGIQRTTVEQIYQNVGISRTFFYSFFPAKEDLVIQAFYRQQPQMLVYAKSLMEDPKLSWRASAAQFLRQICYGGQEGFTIMSVEEQQALFKCLSDEKRQEFQRKRLTFFTELIQILGIHTEESNIKLLGNLVFSAAILHKAIPDTLPFLFAEASDEMIDFQIETILEYMETLYEQSKNKESK